MLKPYKPAEENTGTLLGRISSLLNSASTQVATPVKEQQEEALVKPAPPIKRKAPAPVEAAIVRTLTYDPFLEKKTGLGKKMDDKAAAGCVHQKSSESFFCIEPVHWPKEIGDAFQVHTTLYRGRKGITHYENGKAAQFHILFPQGNYASIVDYFTKRFGEPSQKPEIRAVVFAGPDRKNSTVRWLGPKDKDGAASVLEIRQFDDLRWSAPPDTRHGVVRLYRKGQEPVFRSVSWSDFLLARIGRR